MTFVRYRRHMIQEVEMQGGSLSRFAMQEIPGFLSSRSLKERAT